MSKFLRGIKNVSYLSLGTAFAEVIHLFSFVLIARELTIEDYGIWTSIGAFVGLFYFFTFEGLGKVVIREGSRDIGNMAEIFNRTIGLKNIFLIIATIICLVSLVFMPYSQEIKLYIAFGSYLLLIN